MGTWSVLFISIAIICFVSVLTHAFTRIEAVAKEAKAQAAKNFEQLEIIQRKLSDMDLRVVAIDELFRASEARRQRSEKEVQELMQVFAGRVA